jgi:hypothetical protein
MLIFFLYLKTSIIFKNQLNNHVTKNKKKYKKMYNIIYLSKKKKNKNNNNNDKLCCFYICIFIRLLVSIFFCYTRLITIYVKFNSFERI